MPNAMSSLLAECAGLLDRVDEPMARAFVPLLRSAADRPASSESAAFPFGSHPGLGAATLPATAPAVDLTAAAAAHIRWGHPPAEHVPPGWAHAAAAATLVGPGASVDAPAEAVFGLFYMSPGLDYPDHWHDAEEFYLVLAGSAVWTVGDTTATYRAGDYTRTPSQAVHRIVTHDEPVLAIWGWSGDTSFDTYGY